MSRLAATDVPHTSQTDHRVLRNPRPTAPVAAASKGPSVLFDDAEQRIPPLEVTRARGLLLAIQAERDKNALRANEAAQLLFTVNSTPDDVPLIEALGIVAKILGRDDEARKYWEQVLSVDPRNEEVLKRLAILCHEIGEDEQGVKYLDRLFEINSWQADLYGRHAHMLGRLRRIEAGIRSAERGLQLNPMQFQLRSWLAEALEHVGNQAESKRQREILRQFGENK